MSFLNQVPRYLFFTGKGGVGKTSIACASALELAGRGKHVLLVSTDPASNLDDVLDVHLGLEPRSVPGAPGLMAANLDPEATAAAYREKVVGPYRGLLPEAAVVSMEEQLSGACTVEIAAFDEFARLLGNLEATGGFEHVLFDTAPTGHTLRLLSLPSAWDEFIDTSSHGTSCLGPLAGLQQQKALYHAAVGALSDSNLTQLVLVSRPEKAALSEAARASEELAQLGVHNQLLLVNGLFQAHHSQDPVAVAMAERGRRALAGMPSRLKELARVELPLAAHTLVGVSNLRRLFGAGETGRQEWAPVATAVTPLVSAPDAAPPATPDADPTATQDAVRASLPPPLCSLIDELARDGRGAVMTMGKGGVGKTTVAAAIAMELASRGHRVHLTTTDPAAHVSAAVGKGVDGLRVSRIDPKAAVAAYCAEVLQSVGKDLSPEGRALLEEDLRSPCTEEIAVFRAFADAVDAASDGYVILDTAPTGHTILLLDAAEAYHLEVSKKSDHTPESVRQLLPRLRDPSYTRVLLVTLPETTPVAEAKRLQDDLRRAGIEPYGWVINQSLQASGTHDPLLRLRASLEKPFIDAVQMNLSARCALIPWLIEEPIGHSALAILAHA